MFDKINQKLTQLYCKIATDIYCAKNSEQGDTNFISIIIVLGIVIVIAGIFVSFKDDILGSAEDAINDYSNLFKKESTTK